jgi:hypothetical protein
VKEGLTLIGVFLEEKNSVARKINTLPKSTRKSLRYKMKHGNLKIMYFQKSRTKKLFPPRVTLKIGQKYQENRHL